MSEENKMSEEKEVKLFRLYKPCGKKMKVNKDSYNYALNLGWTKKKPNEKND